MLKLVAEIGALFIFYKNAAKLLFTTSGYGRHAVDQMLSTFQRSLSTVIFAGIFVGAILVLQFDQMLAQYDASSMLGGLNTSAIVKEVGPLIISFLLAGKVGAYTAAELGTMRVTEQIEAIECLGTNSVQYLIIPRFIGIVLSSVLLLVVGLIVSVAGGMVVAHCACGINYLEYASTISRFTTPWTIFCGVFKCITYAIIVAGISCYKGYTASGGAKGVGQAVTSAAIYTNFYIVIAQYITATFLETAEIVLKGFIS